MFIQLVSAACIAASAIGSPLKPDDITETHVDHAIQLIKAELLDRFDEENGWEPEANHTNWLSKGLGGSTAVATLALLNANQSQHSKVLSTALKQLESVKVPSTYVCAMRTMIYCRLLPKYDKLLKLNVRKLIESMSREGSWGYGNSPPTSDENASPIIRRFASVALLEAHRKGIRIPAACFGAIAQAVLKTQRQDGGWSHSQENSAPNATVAGFNCLLGASEVLGDQLTQKQHEMLNHGLHQALGWLHKNYAPTYNTGGTAMMSYLCGLERVAMSCGLDRLRNRDWYREGVAALLKAHCSSKKKAKGSTVNLSFALLFLTRGRVPLALVELRTNKTTLDSKRLSRNISLSVSNQIERRLSWRVVTIDDDVDRWLQAPLLLIQDKHALPENHDAIKEFLDRGGLLLFIGDKKNAQVFSKVASNLCPESTHSATRKMHWATDLIQNAKGILIESWNDGIRDQIILVRNDPQKFTVQKQSRLTKAVVNICCGAAELSKWKTRLSTQQIELDHDVIVLASHAGRWDIEQTGLRQCGIPSKPLNQLSSSKVAIVGGIDASDVTNVLVEDVIAATKRGAIVIIEPIGGLGDFASVMRTAIGNKLSATLEPDSALMQEMQPIVYRGWSLRNNVPVATPLVVPVGSGQIIFLDADIRNSILGHPAWGVHGYDTQTAVALLNSLCKRTGRMNSPTARLLVQ